MSRTADTNADDIFYAAISLVEAQRLLFLQWATSQKKGGADLKLRFVDVKKACVYGVPDRSIYLRLPCDLGMPKNVVGKLIRSMYGTRELAPYGRPATPIAVDMGVARGVASP